MLFTVLQTFDHHKNYHIHGMRAAWCAYCFHEPTTNLNLEGFITQIRKRSIEPSGTTQFPQAVAVQAIIALQKGKEVPNVA